MGEDNLNVHRDLLARTVSLRSQHGANRPPPFNIFTVLRKPSDEVDLHSKFLAALLDHVDPESRERENLRDFLTDVVGIEGFDPEGVSIERESGHIDLLIAGAGAAVIVENKIYAGDQWQQLKRYYERLTKDGGRYAKDQVSLCYLTLYGDSPEDHSIGEYGEHLHLASYASHIPEWLLRCQRRACDDPPLRESIGQYRHTVLGLTGNDHQGVYMDALRNLCSQPDYLLAARDIHNAMAESLTQLVSDLWAMVHDRVHAHTGLEIDPKYLGKSEDWAIKWTIENTGQKHETHVYYLIGDACWLWLGGRTLQYGVYCEWTNPQYKAIKDALSDVGPAHYTYAWTPWYAVPDNPKINIRSPNDEALQLLSSGPDRVLLADRIAHDLCEIWDVLQSKRLIAVA